MMKKLLVLLTLGVFATVAMGACDKKKEEEATEEKTEKKEEGKEEKGTEEKPEEKPREEAREARGGGGGGACEAYEKCCKDYVKALEGVKSVPKASLDAAKKGCEQIANLKKLPTAQEACKRAMDAMKKGAAAMSKMPGFKMPESCK
jgi:hypothetical protein